MFSLTTYRSYSLTAAVGDFNHDGLYEPIGFISSDQGALNEYPRLIPPNLAFGQTYGRADRDTRYADFDGDGYTDIFQNVYSPAANEDSRIRIYFGSASGFVEKSGFVPNLGGYGETIIVADFDGDGDIDIYNPAYAKNNEPGSYLLINDGRGRFTDETARTSVDGIAGALSFDNDLFDPQTLWPGSDVPEGAQGLDFNNDGRIDLFVAARLLLNDGNLAFSDVYETLGLPRRFDEGATFADFNNDGALDFVTLHPDLGPLLFYQEDGHFVPKNEIFGDEDLTYAKAYGVQAVDANSDGFLDIWINGASGGSPARLFLNDRGQGFTRAELGYENILAAFSPGVAAPAMGDFNGDGAVDMLQRSAANRDSVVALSDSGPVHGAVLLEVLGSRGEKDQFGRVIRVADRDDSSAIQTRIVDGGSGYMSQSAYSIAVPLQSNSVKSVSVSPFFFGDSGYSFELSSGFGAQIFAATPTSSAHVRIYAAYPLQLDASPRQIRGAHGDDELSGSHLADQLWGGGGDDALWGEDGDDALQGEQGADVLQGGAGNDFLNGGEGTDLLSGGEDNDTLLGGADADTLSGGLGDDQLIGEDGNDRLYGEGGNDVLNGGAGADLMVGGGGDDVYYVDNTQDLVVEQRDGGNDRIVALIDWALAPGQDIESLVADPDAAGLTLEANELRNSVTGGAGADLLFGAGGDDELFGEAGDDFLSGGDGSDALFGGEGQDGLNGGPGDNYLAGGGGNDIYYVNGAGDVVAEEVGGGNDTVYPTSDWTMAAGQEIEALFAHPDISGIRLEGNEFGNAITGSRGNDFLQGGGGDDVIQGGASNDYLNGGTGDDRLYGGDGDDGFNGDVGADLMVGGAGNDVYYVDDSGDRVEEGNGSGFDTVYTTVNWTMAAGQEIEALFAHPDISGIRLEGNEFGNAITGSRGNDFLQGGGGDDVIQGGASNDYLNGEEGIDRLFGDDGDDELIFDLLDSRIDGGAGIDTLRLAGADQEIDLIGASHGRLFAFEIINLMGTGDNTVRLSYEDVLSISGTSSLRIDGDAGDRLVMAETQDWLRGADQFIGSEIYQTYSQGSFMLLIDPDVSNNLMGV